MTVVNRLKVAPPHFVAHVTAPAPKIIMRRFATSERTVTPATGITGRAIKRTSKEVQLYATALAALRNPASSARRALLCARSDPSRLRTQRVTLSRN